MQNSGTQQNAGRNTSKGQSVPPGEQMGTDDTQSEFSVHEARQAAAQEENEQRQQQNADAKQEKPLEQRLSAQAEDPQSEFSVEQRLRDDQK